MLKAPERIIGMARDELAMGPPAPSNVVRLGPGVTLLPASAGGGRRGAERKEEEAVTMTRWTRVRIAVCGVVLLVLFGAVGVRAFNLQVRDADRLRAMAEEQYLREIELPPRRGRILDRNGAELASTADVDSIYCNPRQLPDPRDAARRLSRALGIERAELERKLGQRRFFAWVKRRVTPRRGHGGQGAGAARGRVHARAAALLSEPHAGGDGDGARGVGGQRPGRRRAGAGQAAARHVVVGAGDAGRAGARHRGRRRGRRAQHRGQRRGADHRPLPDVHHRAGAGGGRGRSTTPRARSRS